MRPTLTPSRRTVFTPSFPPCDSGAALPPKGLGAASVELVKVRLRGLALVLPKVETGSGRRYRNYANDGFMLCQPFKKGDRNVRRSKEKNFHGTILREIQTSVDSLSS